jgi:hypothetical protein
MTTPTRQLPSKVAERKRLEPLVEETPTTVFEPLASYFPVYGSQPAFTASHVTASKSTPENLSSALLDDDERQLLTAVQTTWSEVMPCRWLLI